MNRSFNRHLLPAGGDPNSKFRPCGSAAGLLLYHSPVPRSISCSARDRGRGISADKIETIFERFQQIDDSDTRNDERTGWGLAIGRSIVQQHGGEIRVESQVGEGSTSYFTLPVPGDQNCLAR